MVKLTRADHLRMEADKKRKSIQGEYKSVDFYDTDILEKTLKNPKPGAEIPKQESKHDSDDQKFDLEFHEQFFS
jgi:hypothetical protein